MYTTYFKCTHYKNDPGRTRTCNLWFRRPTPYPLGHRTLELFNQLEIQRYSRTKSSNTGIDNRCWRSGSAKPERSRHSSAPQSQNDLAILRHREHCAISCSSSSSSLSSSSWLISTAAARTPQKSKRSRHSKTSPYSLFVSTTFRWQMQKSTSLHGEKLVNIFSLSMEFHIVLSMKIES